MSALQAQLLQSVEGLSEVHIQAILEMITSFRKSIEFEKEHNAQAESSEKRKLGILKGRTLIAEGYDFGEAMACWPD